MSNKIVSTIVDRYSFNVPKFETLVSATVGRGGDCQMPCGECLCKKSGICSGCNKHLKGGCPDKHCKGENCKRCVVLCSRGGDRLAEAIDFMGGNLDIDLSPRKAHMSALRECQRRIDSASIPGFFSQDAYAVSIPWYAIFDFINEKPVASDIKSYFGIGEETKVIVNSYMKDDKVMVLFEYLLQGKLFDLMRSFKGVDFWHTPCFSVFDESSSMDQLLNFKRQFHVGDLMENEGFNIIQEVLFTISDAAKVRAGYNDIIKVVKKKRITHLSLCGQLQTGEPGLLSIDFYKQIPSSCILIANGFPPKWRDCIDTHCKCKVIHADYRKQYKKRR